MKLMKTLLTLTIASACAFAQNPIASTKAAVKQATATKSAAIEKALPAPAPKPSAASKPATKPATPAPPKAAATTPAAAPAPNEAEAAKGSSAADALAKKGPRRDPFVSPIVQKVTASVSCTGGKKCLEPGQVTLKGVVSSDNGKIAVVTNPANKAYFLREQDPVLNGYVVRITQDSIVFRENVTDRLGKVSQREVVKKVSAPAV